MTSKELYSCDFEIFGKVQRVFFRKYTEKKAKELGLRGWVMNTPAGSVKGTMEGSQDVLEKMKFWLSTTGSPKSSIAKANFSNFAPILSSKFNSFEIRK